MAFFDKHKNNLHNNDKQADGTNESEPKWLKNLAAMRRQRQNINGRDKTVLPPSAGKNLPAETYLAQIRKNRRTPVSAELKNKVYAHYLNKWSEEQNKAATTTATQVLLTDVWTAEADNILLEPQSVSGADAEILIFNDNGSLEESSATEPASLPAGVRESEQSVPAGTVLNVTVVRPQLDAGKSLAVVDAGEFCARVKAVLKPQLQDLLESSIKTLLLTNYDIMLSCVRQELQSAIPALLEEALECNLKKIIKGQRL